MELGESELRCLKYINSHLREPLKERTIGFRTWKSCADIQDINIYHQVAQGLKKAELKQGAAGLFYIVTIPKTEEDRFGDSWNITLVGGQNRTFLDKYGEHYKVIPI